MIEPGSRTLRAQSILYRNPAMRVLRAVEHLDRAVELALESGALASVQAVLGDCSPTPVFQGPAVAELSAAGRSLVGVEHRFFNANLGSAAGHNRLLEDVSEDLVLIMNPDVLLAPEALVELLRPFKDASVGMVEARQLPVEHPKEYDLASGETDWASTACAVLPASLLQKLEGFDARGFFLYGDDVDLSWRVRLAGFKVLYQPSAVVFHDKRLTPEAGWPPSPTEVYYSAEAALMLAHKYSRPDRVEALLRDFQTSGEAAHRKAAQEFYSRRAAGMLPAPIDPTHSVSEFRDGFYTHHRHHL